MTWIQARSGTIVDLVDPQPEQIKTSDIAHSLARLCRFTGHTRDFYSVAQHTCLVEGLIPRSNDRLRALAILHDTAEAYTGDVVTPIKHLIKPWFAPIEERLMSAIYAHYNIDPPVEVEQEIIKWADHSILLTERRDLMEPTKDDWSQWCVQGVRAQPQLKIQPWSVYTSESALLQKLKEVERQYGKA